MSPLFETIKCENGKLINLSYHSVRMNDSRKILFNTETEINLAKIIQIPDFAKNGLFRCRVNYGIKIDKIEFFEYQPKHPKSVKLLECSEIDYTFKYNNRSVFSQLLVNNPEFDDIIITQNKMLTDATYSNLAFFDGEIWHTPTTYLLKGTKRSYLLDKQLIKESEIKADDLYKFSKIAFINAMRDLDLAYDFIFVDGIFKIT